jgi:hypothetical protein
LKHSRTSFQYVGVVDDETGASRGRLDPMNGLGSFAQSCRARMGEAEREGVPDQCSMNLIRSGRRDDEPAAEETPFAGIGIENTRERE